MFDGLPYCAAALVLLWALASFAMAVSGGQRAGLHEVAAPRPPAPAPEPEAPQEEPAPEPEAAPEA